jgi:hypothetical protein
MCAEIEYPSAIAGIVDALIAAEAMRTMIPLMGELHTASCCEETYSSAGLSSIARASFVGTTVVAPYKPWLRKRGGRAFTSIMTKRLPRRLATTLRPIRVTDGRYAAASLDNNDASVKPRYG